MSAQSHQNSVGKYGSVTSFHLLDVGQLSATNVAGQISLRAASYTNYNVCVVPIYCLYFLRVSFAVGCDFANPREIKWKPIEINRNRLEYFTRKGGRKERREGEGEKEEKRG